MLHFPSMNEEMEKCVLQNIPWTNLPPSVKQVIFNITHNFNLIKFIVWYEVLGIWYSKVKMYLTTYSKIVNHNNC